MRTRTQFLVAAVMFAMCVGIGSLADMVMRGAVSWLARSAGHSTHLQLAVRSRAHVMRIRNLTDEAWSGCVVTVDGRYQSPQLSIEPQGLATIPYALFAADTQPLGDAEGFGRAFRSTSIACADEQHQTEMAVLR